MGALLAEIAWVLLLSVGLASIVALILIVIGYIREQINLRW